MRNYQKIEKRLFINYLNSQLQIKKKRFFFIHISHMFNAYIVRQFLTLSTIYSNY